MCMNRDYVVRREDLMRLITLSTYMNRGLLGGEIKPEEINHMISIVSTGAGLVRR